MCCCALAVATAVSVLSSSTTEAFAPHQPQQQVLPPNYPEELSNMLQTKLSIAPSQSPPLSSSLSSKVFITPAATLNSNSAKRKKRMQRPVLDSALKQKKVAATAELLTAAQEIEYSYRIRTFRAAVKLRDQLVRFQDGVYIHPTESEWATACGTSVVCLRLLIEEGQLARSALVSCNAGLVIQQAKRHHAGLKYATEAGGGVGTILTVSDMIQEGNLGLMEAAERFEPEKGFRFSTYATYWVRQRIMRSISDSSRIIRLPAHVHDMLQKMRKAKVEMKGETGREPNLTELAHYMEMSEDKLRLYTASSRNVVSLERPLVQATGFKSREDRRTLGDTLASDAPTPEEDAVQDSMRRDIRAVMDTELAGVERQVLVYRFGLEDRKPLSVTETAAALCISRDRVRLVEARALNKLRHPTRNYKLKEYIHEEGSSSSTASLEETFANSPTEQKSDRIWFF
jgi:RNA polymerase primary sigma factor